MISNLKTGQSNKRRNAIAAVSVTVLAAVLILLCLLPYGTDHELDDVLPKIGQAPVYEELTDGQTFECMYMAPMDMHVKSLELLLVNTEVGADAIAETTESDHGRPFLHIKVVDLLSSNSTPLWEGDVPLSDLKTGSWSSVPADFFMHEKHLCSFEFTPSGCSPYFMKVDAYEPGISLGFRIESDRHITLEKNFPYAVPAIFIIALIAVLILLLGNEKTLKVFNVLFLMLLFVSLSLKIYKTAYIDGIYITADSDGYLREAVNLIAGNGFSYEGLAGYRSHFANWPIIYPAMIAGMMLITGVNAYLASKYVTFIILALILIVLYAAFKDRAWIYSLALLNLGFLGIAYHTWSELPFILFMMLFVLCLGKVASTEKPSLAVYVGLGASALATFLTRYFGIFLWFVAGAYMVPMFIRDKKKSVKMAFSMGISGVLAFAYLMMNKIYNGNPTGVARGTWWDDYRTLTIDLINSLVTEVFNVFSVEVPGVIANMSISLKVVVVLVVAILLAVLIVACLRKTPFAEAVCKPTMIFVVTAVFYYVMFTVIRYRSSMDTFYFRFFAPASVLLVIGLIGLLLDSQYVRIGSSLLGVFVSIALLGGLITTETALCRERNEETYYDIITEVWSDAYSEIPNKSVILWNPMDFRSSWYRPDVYSGELLPNDTWESLTDRYYGSNYICMLKSDAEVVVLEGGYDDSVADKLSEALKLSDAESQYLIVKK